MVEATHFPESGSANSYMRPLSNDNSVGLLGNFGLAELALERMRAPSGLMKPVCSLLCFGSLRLDNNFRIKAADETLQNDR